MLNLAISIIPILLLIWMMTKKNVLPSHIALPLTALIVGILQLVYFGTDGRLLTANIISGTLSAITPISIIAGVILLNSTLLVSGCEDVIKQWLEGISKNCIGQLMIIGWVYKTLYVPPLIPFFLVVLASILFLKMNRHQVMAVFCDTALRIPSPLSLLLVR